MLAALGLPYPESVDEENAQAATDLGGMGVGGGPGALPGGSVGAGDGSQLSPDLLASLGLGGGGGDQAGALGGGVQPSVGATPDSAAPTLFGYSPQPKPPLPTQIAGTEEAPSNPIFDQFKDVFGGDQAEPDFLTQFMEENQKLPGARGATPDSRSLIPPWMGGGSGGGSYGPGPTPSPAGQMMRDRFPAALQRLNWLRDMRTRRGY
jgi:hypothetical protein